MSRWSRADPPDWVPDEACNSCIACKAPFTVIRRKHHCRSCGKVRASFSSVKQSSWQESRRWSYCCGNRWLRAGGPWLTRCFVLCHFRSSALAAPPTLHLCPATVRWSRSGCAHTATCSTSRPFTVTKLASDYSNYHRNKIKKAHSPLQHGRMQQTNLGVVYKASATLPESGPLRLTEHQDPRVTDWRWETPVPQSEPQTWLLCPADINHSKILVWLRLQKQKVYEGAVTGFDWSWARMWRSSLKYKRKKKNRTEQTTLFDVTLSVNEKTCDLFSYALASFLQYVCARDSLGTRIYQKNVSQRHHVNKGHSGSR